MDLLRNGFSSPLCVSLTTYRSICSGTAWLEQQPREVSGARASCRNQESLLRGKGGEDGVIWDKKDDAVGLASERMGAATPHMHQIRLFGCRRRAPSLAIHPPARAVACRYLGQGCKKHRRTSTPPVAPTTQCHQGLPPVLSCPTCQ
jgi:hypothetical protein